MRYVERNPVRAGLVKTPWEYPWSSAAAHVKKGGSPIRLTQMEMIGIGPDWEDYLTQGDDIINNAIREKTAQGLVVGTDEFIAKIELQTGRRLTPRAHGHPDKRVSS
jgi:putative transposase